MKRTVLSFVILCAAACAAYAGDYPKTRIETTFDTGDGRLVLYNYHTGESIDVAYRKGKRYDKKSLERITAFFRCRSDKKEYPIDIELIELLDHLQDHFGAGAIELISGYRSPELNRGLKRRGVNVAEESLHMEGKAADIHIDEVTEEAVVEYARSLSVGGVGFYPKWDFVHVDTGDVRKWDLPDSPGRLLIAFRKSPEWQVTTDKNIYVDSEEIRYEIMNITRAARGLNGAPRLELFRRGKWIGVGELEYQKEGRLAAGARWNGAWIPSDKDGFGKYRIVIEGPSGLTHLESRSNEFYRKKR